MTYDEVNMTQTYLWLAVIAGVTIFYLLDLFRRIDYLMLKVQLLEALMKRQLMYKHYSLEESKELAPDVDEIRQAAKDFIGNETEDERTKLIRYFAKHRTFTKTFFDTALEEAASYWDKEIKKTEKSAKSK